MTPPGTEQLSQADTIASIGQYQYGWHDSDAAGQAAQRGLTPAIVEQISAIKGEPPWMLENRLKALKLFDK
ncbi:MAG: hypothetical protein LBG11_11585, partial [Bifidobacteriaceae bacterium]|nr:hypothetical protein [Bifidobacteriaceae bacterium]